MSKAEKFANDLCDMVEGFEWAGSGALRARQAIIKAFEALERISTMDAVNPTTERASSLAREVLAEMEVE